jgi:hypothetical protein
MLFGFVGELQIHETLGQVIVLGHICKFTKAAGFRVGRIPYGCDQKRRAPL